MKEPSSLKELKNAIEKKDAPIDVKLVQLQKQAEEIKKRLTNIDETKLTNEQKSKLSKIKEISLNISRKIFKTLRWTVLVGSLLTIGNYERTRYKVETTTINVKGKEVKEYKHEDARTTHLLNILAGREKFTDKDLRDEYDAFVQKYFDDYGVKITKKVSEMSIEEIDSALSKNAEKIGYLLKEGELIQIFNDNLNDLNSQLEKSNEERSFEAYELVWQMEQECGNPIIRFVNESTFFDKYRTNAYRFSAQEDPINNTIYVSPKDLIASQSNTVFAELSHLKDYNDDPVGVSINYLVNFAKVLKEGGFDDKKLSAAYDKLYKIPGTFEHTAHQVIQPYLEKKYSLLKKEEKTEK